MTPHCSHVRFMIPGNLPAKAAFAPTICSKKYAGFSDDLAGTLTIAGENPGGNAPIFEYSIP
ncbi:MAG: hypothetical protein LBF89_06115 [Bacteroidales bacterium]|nr:hypothetical protein [Bacteroidales bacterium]